ncbi:pilin [Actinomadura rupiterrae]|uniref:pilin n=1 Tax=Actinomadura rupiterrae TaxID=559627 RepID=UPI0020A29B98|nr:pilin [Actinomadura rupiterrae]MCP2341175.1 hypothetical protein [Actinomadura rupiterrae]
MRMLKALVRLVVLVAAAGLVAAGTGAAAWAAPLGAPADLNTVLNNLTKLIVSLLSALATLFLTIAGVLYLTAGGNPEQVSKAKNALKNAAIGYAIAVLAPLLLVLLQKVVGQ